jgi:hypothetical protein
MPNDTGNALTATDTCIVKDERMAPCRGGTVYLTAEQAVDFGLGLYSGYYHTDDITDHHAVPSRWI